MNDPTSQFMTSDPDVLSLYGAFATFPAHTDGEFDTRVIQFAGITYDVSILPAHIRRKSDSETIWTLPGSREEIIERTLRHFAASSILFPLDAYQERHHDIHEVTFRISDLLSQSSKARATPSAWMKFGIL